MVAVLEDVELFSFPRWKFLNDRNERDSTRNEESENISKRKGAVNPLENGRPENEVNSGAF